MEYISGSRLPSPTPVNVNSDSSLFRAKTGIAILSEVDKWVLYINEVTYLLF